MNWLSKLTSEGRSHNAASQIDANLTALGAQWREAGHEVKLASGELMMDTMRHLIPDYDFSRNAYVQFFSFALEKPELLEQRAKHFTDIATAARTEDQSLFFVTAILAELFTLFAINTGSKRDDTRKEAGALYATHSRTVNDMIQYVLFHHSPAGTRHRAAD